LIFRILRAKNTLKIIKYPQSARPALSKNAIALTRFIGIYELTIFVGIMKFRGQTDLLPYILKAFQLKQGRALIIKPGTRMIPCDRLLSFSGFSWKNMSENRNGYIFINVE
jgi:hypothetical protein